MARVNAIGTGFEEADVDDIVRLSPPSIISHHVTS